MAAPAIDHLGNDAATRRPSGRGDTACALLGCALVLSIAAGGAVAALVAPAQAQEVAPDSAVLRGADIGDEQLPLDAAGRPIVDALPGVLPPRQAPQAARDDLGPLEEERDRVLDAARAARVSTTIPPLPGDVHAPAPLDSGAADPDHLLPDAQLPLPTF